MPSQKIDYKKELRELYLPSVKEVTVLDVPAMNYLMVDGTGDPDTSKEAKAAIETLFPVAYAIKFSIKRGRGIDYGVMPLEGLWWADDMKSFTAGERTKWKFTYMIMQPELVTKKDVENAIEAVTKKKNLPGLAKIRFESFNEGQAAQMMHIGPFSTEPATITKIHNQIRLMGGSFNGKTEKHHEIYLNDYRKVDPAKMKTILRQPFRS